MDCFAALAGSRNREPSINSTWCKPNLVSPIANEAEKKLVKVFKNKFIKEALFVLFTNIY